MSVPPFSNDPVPPAPPIDRRGRRRRGNPRARWIAARTANASQRALLIAAVGSLVMIAMLLTFVLIPRRADRQLAQALAALPPLRDTVALRTAQRAARLAYDRALARQAALRPLAEIADSVALLAPVNAPNTAEATPAPALAPPLAQQLARARQAPLVESYRALVATRALSSDARARALLDTIEALNREREAQAALGGPDARYAALTARLTALGQRLDTLAATRLAALSMDSVPLSPLTVSPTPVVTVDSLAALAVASASDTLARIDSALSAARTLNAALLAQQQALRERTQVLIPPVAMLLASLVLGLSVGFAVALAREMRRPTVGDADELEALTHARVITHASGGRDDAWTLLHLALTHIGDVVHHVQVLADRPVLAGTVGLNLAAVAARESRATLLADLATSAAVVPLLPPAALRARRRADTERGDDSAWDTSRVFPVGGDREGGRAVALVLPRRGRGTAAPEAATASASASATASATTLAPLTASADLTVFVADQVTPALLPASLAPRTEVVLCARRGVTSLTWLTDAVRVLREAGRPLRSVVLWDGELPLVGGVQAD